MKIQVEKENLLKALQKVSSVIGSRTTLAVLANVLLETKKNELVLTATDLEIRLTTSIQAQIDEPGSTTLPAKKMLGLVSKLRNGIISIESNENFHAELKSGTAAIMLLGLNPVDFPAEPEFTAKRSFTIKQADISVMLDRITYAASIENSKKVLQGVLFSMSEGKLTLVATDGKRLALSEKIMENLPEDCTGDIIVTLKAALELKHVMEKDGDVEICIAENQIMFKLSDTVIFSKLIEGNYPNFRVVIPTVFKHNITIPCDQFVYVLELLNVTLSESNTPNVKLTFSNNKLTFDANSNIGEGRESIDIEYSGDDMDASFNPNFLLDPFRHLQMDKVSMKINDIMSPIAIESGDGFMYVIMPMRK